MTSTSARADQIAALSSRHAARLQRTVAARVTGPPQTIEDACQNAWAILMGRDDIQLDDGVTRWLATVAIRDGWRLESGARDRPMGTMPGGDRLPEPAAPAPGADE